MKQITAEDVRKLREETGEGMMAYTQQQYAELESRCNSWRQLCYKHEQTICDLKYQIVMLEAGVNSKGLDEPAYTGTGSDYLDCVLGAGGFEKYGPIKGVRGLTDDE